MANKTKTSIYLQSSYMLCLIRFVHFKKITVSSEPLNVKAFKSFLKPSYINGRVENTDPSPWTTLDLFGHGPPQNLLFIFFLNLILDNSRSLMTSST